MPLIHQGTPARMVLDHRGYYVLEVSARAIDAVINRPQPRPALTYVASWFELRDEVWSRREKLLSESEVDLLQHYMSADRIGAAYREVLGVTDAQATWGLVTEHKP